MCMELWAYRLYGLGFWDLGLHNGVCGFEDFGFRVSTIYGLDDLAFKAKVTDSRAYEDLGLLGFWFYGT